MPDEKKIFDPLSWTSIFPASKFILSLPPITGPSMKIKDVSRFIDTEFATNEYPSNVFPWRLSNKIAELVDARYFAKLDDKLMVSKSLL